MGIPGKREALFVPPLTLRTTAPRCTNGKRGSNTRTASRLYKVSGQPDTVEARPWQPQARGVALRQLQAAGESTHTGFLAVFLWCEVHDF